MCLLIENHGSDVDFIEISSETKNRPGKSRPVLFQNLIPRTAVESFYFNLREQVGKLRSALYVPWRHPRRAGGLYATPRGANPFKKMLVKYNRLLTNIAGIRLFCAFFCNLLKFLLLI